LCFPSLAELITPLSSLLVAFSTRPTASPLFLLPTTDTTSPTSQSSLHSIVITPSRTDLPLLSSSLANLIALPGSGEYSVASLLRPGAFARSPLLDRVTSLGSDIGVVFAYGDKDWMDADGGREAVKVSLTFSTRRFRLDRSPFPRFFNLSGDEESWKPKGIRLRLPRRRSSSLHGQRRGRQRTLLETSRSSSGSRGFPLCSQIASWIQASVNHRVG